MWDSKKVANAFGYMTENEIRTLQIHAERLASAWARGSYSHRYPGGLLAVNVGAGAGTSSLAIREVSSVFNIYSIDISDGGPLGGMEGERNAFARAGFAPPIQIVGDSGTVAKEWGFGEIDLLFVDDGHKREDIKRDIKYWLPNMADGGLVAFHDYGAERWPDVKEVIDSTILTVLPINKVYDRVDALIIVKINKRYVDQIIKNIEELE